MYIFWKFEIQHSFWHELTSFSVEVYNREEGGEVNEKFTIRYVPKMAPFGEHAIFSFFFTKNN